MKKLKKITPVILSILITTGCAANAATDVTLLEEEETYTPVMTQTIAPGSISNKIVYAGRIEPASSVSVASKMSGKVKQVFFDVGDRVSSGDALFRLDEKDIEDQILQLQSQLNIAEQGVKTAQNSLDTVTGGQYKSQVTQLESAIQNSDKQVDSAELALENANVQHKNAQTSVESAEASVRNAELVVENAELSVEKAQLSVEDAKLAVEDAKLAVENAELAVGNAELAVGNAELIQENAEVAYQSAQLGLNNAQDSFNSIVVNYNNIKTLYEAGTVSKHEFDNIELTYKQASAAVEQAKHVVEQAALGVEQANQGVEQAKRGVEQANQGVEQAKQGVVRANHGVAQANYNVVQARQGVEQANQGVVQATKSVEQAMTGIDQSTIAQNQARVTYDQAVIGLEQAQSNYDITTGQVTAENVERAAIGVSQAQASKASIQTQIDVARSTLADTTVRSPMSGVVSINNAKTGEFTSAASPAFVIVDLDRVNVEVSVSEILINSIAIGDVVSVYINTLGTDEIKGRIVSISPTADQTSTFPVKIEIENPSAIIKPGMFAEVHFVREQSDNTVVIPRNTIFEDESGYYLYVDDNGTAKKVVVTTGIDNGREIEILSGITNEDKVIVTGHDYITDGDRIKVVEE